MDNKNVVNESLNKKIEVYRKRIVEDSLSSTYKFLLTYMNHLQRTFKSEMSESFSTKNLLNGYLDYSYFYFDNKFLKSRKLKMGIVLNHHDLSFELWLMGSTKESQVFYWKKFKEFNYINDDIIPEWYILSVTLVSNPDFDNLNNLSRLILDQVPRVYNQIEKQLLSLEK